MIILKNLSEVLFSDIYRIARKISKNDEDMDKIFSIWESSSSSVSVFPSISLEGGSVENV